MRVVPLDAQQKIAIENEIKAIEMFSRKFVGTLFCTSHFPLVCGLKFYAWFVGLCLRLVCGLKNPEECTLGLC